MTTQPRKRLIFHWTTPENLLAILLFIGITIIIQYVIITSTIPSGTKDPTNITLPQLNIVISPLYHLLPIAVIITLTTSFTHLTTHTAIMPQKIKTPRKTSPRKTYQKSTRLKSLRQLYKRLQKTTQKIKNKILKTPTIARIQHRIILEKAIIKSATTIVATFIIIIFLITIAAYPQIVPTATTNFYQWNNAFRNFVAATIKASEILANTIPPLGAVATAIQNALIAAAPSFRITLESAASAMTNGLVSLNPTEKYLITQNAAAWIVAFATLLYSQYAKIRRYRR